MGVERGFHDDITIKNQPEDEKNQNITLFAVIKQ